MSDLKEQRICVKFCFKLGKTAKETQEMLKEAFGDDAMGKSQTYEWFRRFKEGRTSVEDDERSGRPSSGRNDENIARVREKILEDRRQTISDLCEALDLSFGTCQRILTKELGMHRIAAKFVPRLLTEDQKRNRVEVCTELKARCEADPNFISNIVTGDESWVYGYDPETKQQSSQWKSPASPRPKKARQVLSKTKSMLICFFDVKGVIHKEFVPQGQTVNGEFYREVLRRLRNRIRRTRPQMWADKSFVLHHDNAPAHTSLIVRGFLASTNFTAINHPPYSPDLAPCDFFCFLK